MVFVPRTGLMLAFELTDYWEPIPFVAVFGVLAILATVPHPGRPDIRLSLDVSRVNRVLLALVIVAAVSLVGVVFIATAEYPQDAEPPTLPGFRRLMGTPEW